MVNAHLLENGKPLNEKKCNMYKNSTIKNQTVNPFECGDTCGTKYKYYSCVGDEFCLFIGDKVVITQIQELNILL